MKKALLVIGSIVGLLVLAVILIPIFFKDEIKVKLDEEIAKNINAKVIFPDIDISLLKNFPNLSLSLDDFGIIGKDTFANDTLANISRLQVVVDLFSVMKGDKISIKKILLHKPRINAKVLANGKANWDIAINQDSTVEEKNDSSSAFSISLNEWLIEDANVRFSDETGPVKMEIKGLNHKGTGDFSQDIIDFFTNTIASSVSLEQNGVKYLNNAKLDITIEMDMNMKEMKFVFKNNSFGINDLVLGLDGSLEMPTDDIKMDLKINTKKTDFKSILSLVPGVYTEGFGNIKTDGSFKLEGSAKGVYSSTSNKLPGFNLKLLIENGFLQYPDLPAPVKNVQLDLAIKNSDGNIDNTEVYLNKLHAELGSSPIDVNLILKGLTKMNLDAGIQAKINFADLASALPMKGMTLKGILDLNVKAKGIYSDLEKLLPSITADLQLKDGFVKSAEIPVTLANTNFDIKVNNETGKMSDMKINMQSLHTEVDGQPFDITLNLVNLDDPEYDVSLKGDIDLGKITRVFPLENMTLLGAISANVQTKGKKSLIDAQKYAQLPTSGTIAIKDFQFKSPDLPDGIKISQAGLAFSPQMINLEPFHAQIGASDVELNGNISNYLGFIFSENETLKGKLIHKSKKFDVNEWMKPDTESESEPPVAQTSTDSASAMTVVEIPANIDFELNTEIGEVLYDNLVLSDFRGNVVIKDKTVFLKNVSFNTMEGTMSMTGYYNTQNLKDPKINFALSINQFNIRKTFEAFKSVQSLAPIAKYSDGKFTTNFNIQGSLKQDMMPDLATLSGGGLINVLQGTVTNFPVMNSVASFSKNEDLKTLNMNDVLMQAEIKAGRLFLKPFDVKAGAMKMNIAGSNGIDKSLDYIMKLDIPAGAVGSAVNSALSSVTGSKSSGGNRLKVNLNIGGFVDNPKVTGGGSETVSAVTDDTKKAIEDKARAEADRLKKEAEAKLRGEADRMRLEAENKAKAEAERVRKEAEDRARAEAERLQREAEEKVKKEGESKAKDFLKNKKWP